MKQWRLSLRLTIVRGDPDKEPAGPRLEATGGGQFEKADPRPVGFAAPEPEPDDRRRY